jgi:ribose 5-phosphate isomerase B
MRIALAADELTGVAASLRQELADRGHETIVHVALAEGERDGWAWTGTGASIASNKVDGIRAALCGDAATAAGARRWNDADVLAVSLRTTSQAELREILDAWFAAAPSEDAEDRRNVSHLAEIEGARTS